MLNASQGEFGGECVGELGVRTSRMGEEHIDTPQLSPVREACVKWPGWIS